MNTSAPTWLARYRVVRLWHHRAPGAHPRQDSACLGSGLVAHPGPWLPDDALHGLAGQPVTTITPAGGVL